MASGEVLWQPASGEAVVLGAGDALRITEADDVEATLTPTRESDVLVWTFGSPNPG